jgi:copper chaperone NosL
MLIAFGLVVAATGNRKLLGLYIGLFIVGGIAAVVDFYKWGYKYGHDLDPNAAIQVPGLSYQPPLLGHKKLLNFDAFSYPDAGAWIVVGAVTLFIIVWYMEWQRNRRHARPVVMKPTKLAFTLLLVILTSCKPEAEKIIVGKDVCAECKMTVADPKFGGEIVTKKGKVYKFDDVQCIAKFLHHRGVELSDIDQTLFVNYNDPSRFIKVGAAEFVVSSLIRSPMGGNAIAFPDKQSAVKKSVDYEGSKVTNWSTLYNILVK